MSKSVSQQFLYFGDTARCPYGERSAAEVVAFASEIIAWLTANGAEAIIMACNTSAALALEPIRRVSQIPIFDLIRPTAQFIADLAKVNSSLKLAVLATSATVKSRAFSKAIQQRSPDLEIIEIACPELVPIIENGDINGANTKAILNAYVDKLLAEKATTLVLGCTHFPFLLHQFRDLVKDRIAIVDPAEVISAQIFDVKSASVQSSRQITDSCTTYVTGDLLNFAKVAELCLGGDLGTIYSVDLNDLVGKRLGDSISSLSKV